MSRTESLEVVDDVPSLDKWIRHVKKRKLNEKDASMCENNDVEMT